MLPLQAIFKKNSPRQREDQAASLIGEENILKVALEVILPPRSPPLKKSRRNGIDLLLQLPKVSRFRIARCRR